jgi:hypothetical protein
VKGYTHKFLFGHLKVGEVFKFEGDDTVYQKLSTFLHVPVEVYFIGLKLQIRIKPSAAAKRAKSLNLPIFPISFANDTL